MSRVRNLSLVVDQVLADVTAASQRRDGEAQAIKVAEAAPRTDLACDFRELAAAVRHDDVHISYADLAGVL